MRYKIGDVSRILGISTDLIRYYEKKGVVKPEKDESNGYRYYDTWDMNFLIDCIWYKNFGFGIDKIADMGNNFSYQNLLEILSGKQSELEETLSRYKLLSERLNEHLEKITLVKEHIGSCDIVQSPEIVCYLNRYSFLYDNRAELWGLSRDWMRYMPFLKRYFEIPFESLTGSGDDSAWGFSLDIRYAKLFKVSAKAPVSHYKPTLCIHSSFKSAGKNAFTARHLDSITDFAKQNGFEICGNARGNLICSVLEGDTVTGYFEVWLPILGN